MPSERNDSACMMLTKNVCRGALGDNTWEALVPLQVNTACTAIWSTCTFFDTSNNFAEGRVHCIPLFFQHHSDQAMARRTSDTDAGVEECKGYSPPNDHTTSASSTPLPLGFWNLNASTRTAESERSARLVFQSGVYCCTKVALNLHRDKKTQARTEDDASTLSQMKARTAERRWMRNPVRPSSCVTPAGTSNELDVQNEWEENTHTHISQESTAVQRCARKSIEFASG